MNFYDIFMFPLEQMILKNIRKNMMNKAYGNVLEIGFGSGVNYKYYDLNKIDTINALDVNENMRIIENVEYYYMSAESLPFLDKSIDTVVLTLALCSIPNPDKVLKEINRILKDDGIYLFIEHEEPKNKIMAKFFNFLNPYWKKMAGGCQINLNSHAKIEEAGFKLDHKNKNIFHYGIATKI